MIPGSQNQVGLLTAYKLGCRMVDGKIDSPFFEPIILENQWGYYYFHVPARYRIYGENRKARCYLHQLTAYQKFGDRLFDPIIHVRHLNNDPKDNRSENIEIGNQSENMMDLPKETRMRTAINAANRLRRFTDTEIDGIRAFHAGSKSYRKTMKKFGIKSKGTLNYILRTQYATSS